jgi:hypothetical protein
MDRNYQPGIKVTLILIGIFYFLKLINLIRVSDNNFFSYALLIYGIVAVYYSFNTDRKAYLFFNTALFLWGVLLYVLGNFNVLNPTIIIIPALIFIFGSCSLIIYLENFTNKIFLYSSLILFLFSIIFIIISKYYFFRGIFNFSGRLLLNYYPFLLIFAGIIIILRRKPIF